MAAIVRNRIINVALRYDITGNKLTSVMHYLADAALGVGDPRLLSNQWETNVLPKWLLAVSEQVTFDSIYSWCDAPGTCRPHTASLFQKVGALVSEALPGNLAAIFQVRQYEVSSKFNGRLFVSGITETQTVDSLLSINAVTNELADLRDALTDTQTIAGGTNFNIGIVHRRESGAPITPVGYKAIGVTVTRALGTQRRRRTEMTSFTA